VGPTAKRIKVQHASEVPPDEFVLGLIQETMVGRKLELIGEKLDRLIELSKPEPAGWPVVLPRFREISTTSYQTVVEWKVGNVWNKERGRLEEISMVSDDYDHTRFRLTVAKNLSGGSTCWRGEPTSSSRRAARTGRRSKSTA